MSRYFEEMRSAIERHGGTVEKFIGDAVMAVFGVPTVHEDDALRAVRAASQMREILATLNAELERDFGARLQIRIGINTGEVVAGDPSAGETFVTGDTVNVAARFEQTAEPGEIVFGEETHRLVRDAVHVEPVEPLELKGKTDRVPAFRLLEVRPGAPAFARRLDSPLVGREEELGRLQRAFDEAVAERACRMVTVLGDAGLGKSRLVTELVARVGGRARMLWARCLPYGEGITFWPVAEAVWEAAAIDESDAPDAARAKLRALVADSEDGAEVAERVSAAIGLAEDAAGGGDIQETFWAVRRLLEIVAADTPLVVLFEDIHWAEPTFLDLLQYVTRFSAERPLLLLCTSRPDLRETRPDWSTLGETIVLEPLSPDQSARPDREPARLGRAPGRRPGADHRRGRGQPAVRRGDAPQADRRATARTRQRPLVGARRSLGGRGARHDQRAARGAARSAGARGARGDPAGLGRRQGLLVGRGDRAVTGGRPPARRLAPADAPAQGARAPRSVRVRGGGRVPVQPHPGPRRGLRFDAEAVARGSAPTLRRLARTQGGRPDRRVRGDRRLPPRTRVPVRGRARTGRRRGASASPRRPPNGSPRPGAARSRTGTSRRPRTCCPAPSTCSRRRIRAVSTSCSTSGSRSRSRTSRGRRPC